MTEWRVWRDGAYEVSSIGEVRRAKPGRRTAVGRLLSPIRMKIGYLAVRPVVDGKNVQFYVHTMVAECFLGTRLPGLEINHIDGDKTNNSVDNLEYVSHLENMRHAVEHGLSPRGERHGNCKLTDAQVAEVRRRAAGGVGLKQMAAEYMVARSTLSSIIARARRVS